MLWCGPFFSSFCSYCIYIRILKSCFELDIIGRMGNRGWGLTNKRWLQQVLNGITASHPMLVSIEPWVIIPSYQYSNGKFVVILYRQRYIICRVIWDMTHRKWCTKWMYEMYELFQEKLGFIRHMWYMHRKTDTGYTYTNFSNAF